MRKNKDGLPDFETEYGSLGGAVGKGLSNMKANAPEKFSELQLHDLAVVRTPYVTIACIVLAFFTGDIAKTVIEAINKVGSVFYGPILATFIAAIALKRVNATGANVGLLSGVAVNIYFLLFLLC